MDSAYNVLVDLIYLDNNATTRPDPQVVQAMLAMLSEWYGNPSSVHRFGQRARQAVDEARGQLSRLIGCAESEILFTSGGTESINTAIRGLLAARSPRKRIVTTAVEHSASRELCQRLAKDGVEIVEIGVDSKGRLDMEAWNAAITQDTALATAMWANNETGVLFPVAELAQTCKSAGVPFHCDGTQAVGKIPVDVKAAGFDLMSLAAHKFHGPKGAGALYVRRGLRLAPLLIGGPQERQRRGGTENTPGIVGMGKAAELAAIALRDGVPASGMKHAFFPSSGTPGEGQGGGIAPHEVQGRVERKPPPLSSPGVPGEEVIAPGILGTALRDAGRIAELRDRLESGILAAIPDTFVNGEREHRLPNTTNIGFARLEAEAILLLLSERGVCASAGAACSSGSLEPSHVLKAMKIPEAIAHGAVRFSLSRFTTQGEIDKTLEILPAAIERLRRVLPVGSAGGGKT